MSVSICVPFRDNAAERGRNWAFLRARYERQFPGWEIVEADCDGPWCKGAAVNRAVEQSSGDVLVVADADVMVSQRALIAAVMILPQSNWVMPQDWVWRMNEDTTQRLLAGGMADDPHPLGASEISYSPRPATEGGGMFVIWRKDFIPMDERFVEWGAEDVSHGRTLDTLIGKHRSLPGILWHLYHEPMPTREGRRAFREESEELALRYLSAVGDRDQMTALLEERESYIAA